MLDTLVLSRMQFAANITFHILFPTITIALCWFLLFFKVRSNQTGDPIWAKVYQFWVKIFALTFALGVVSGVTMSFQFGTNWPGFMEKVGNVAGPLLGYEVLVAFFMEATFLGIMLFGASKVSKRVHTLATLLVAVGTTLSSFWIIVLDSWMQTPAGYEIRDGIVFAQDWLAIIFNPSMPYRFVHMLLASFLTASFLIIGVSSYQILQDKKHQAAWKAFRVALTVAVVLAPIQMIAGDFHGLNTLEHQPQKVAAMEGIWETESGVPMLLFAVPDAKTRSNHFEVPIPHVASLILTHEWDGEIQGVNDFEGAHPPVAPLFFSFRIMVGSGVLMILMALYTYWRLQRASIGTRHLQVLVAMTFMGWIATVAGWYVTEMGRQPFLVTGILRTADAVTQTPSSYVGMTLAAYLMMYAFMLVAYIKTVFMLARKQVHVAHNPQTNIEQQGEMA
jgi:cytochrome d ubiquinol oxidase subunit I